MKSGMTVALVLLCLLGCNRSRPRILPSYDEEEMSEAIERARKEVDSFVAELANPTGDSHAVKIPIEDGPETEHFWLTDVTFQDDKFHGKINNQPSLVSNVNSGDCRTIAT